MEIVLYSIIAFLLMALFLQWRHYRPRHIYEVRIELTGGSVSVVEIKDWPIPIGRVHITTRILHGPCPPPSVRHWVAAAMDRGEEHGEVTLNRITSKWKIVKKNREAFFPAAPNPPAKG